LGGAVVITGIAESAGPFTEAKLVVSMIEVRSQSRLIRWNEC
jgi:hypothetical protein